MIVNFTRALAFGVGLLCLSLVGSTALAQPAAPVEIEAQRLVHLLGYIAADYGVAVENGRIKSQDEYDEQLAFMQDCEEIVRRFGPAAPEALKGDVAGVRARIVAKESPEAVATEAGRVKDDAIRIFRLEVAPTRRPDRGRGEALYAEHCATCHGAQGHADTPRAASLSPRPANFQDPAVGEALTPYRAASTIRFGVNGTSMIPFTFLGEDDRWALAFHVAGLRHAGKEASEDADAPALALGELAVRSDAQLREDLRARGVPDAQHDAVIAKLRRSAPYQPTAAGSTLGIARTKLAAARAAATRGAFDEARGLATDAYLEGIEPAEGSLRGLDGELVRSIEVRFMGLRGALTARAPIGEVDAAFDALISDVDRADAALARTEAKTFRSVALASAGIVLREGVEAALLIAALLGIAAQAGLERSRRWVHYGWIAALALGALTWLASSRLIAISGARRETIEGVTSLLAMGVLFYVSSALLAKREVARWMRFLRAQVSPRRATISLFTVSLLAAYREAFETVLFYQALLAGGGSTRAALAGAAAGAALLTALVVGYSRAGRFAPPQVFFLISSALLYGLAVVFAGQGIAALQVVGLLPIHSLAIPSVPALGIHPTLETTAAQALLILIAIASIPSARAASGPSPTPPAPRTEATAPAAREDVTP